LTVGSSRQQSKFDKFAFDHVFDANSTQQEIFEIVSPLIQSTLDGYNVCIFAYGEFADSTDFPKIFNHLLPTGQTGSGKTYTMDGESQNTGIIPRTVELLFKSMSTASILG
jgi:kinesin family member C1